MPAMLQKLIAEGIESGINERSSEDILEAAREQAKAVTRAYDV